MKNLKPVFDRINKLVAFPIGIKRSKHKRRWVVIDLKNWKRVKVHLWYRVGNYYAATIDGTRTQLHKFIIKVTDPKQKVDHIDGNTYNCTERNLRKATSQQNVWNRSKGRNKRFSSKYIGVSWDKIKNCWQANIAINYKQYKIGYFDIEILAAMAYDSHAKKFRGEFAKLNFPEII